MVSPGHNELNIRATHHSDIWLPLWGYCLIDHRLKHQTLIPYTTMYQFIWFLMCYLKELWIVLINAKWIINKSEYVLVHVWRYCSPLLVHGLRYHSPLLCHWYPTLYDETFSKWCILTIGQIDLRFLSAVWNIKRFLRHYDTPLHPSYWFEVTAPVLAVNCG